MKPERPASSERWGYNNLRGTSQGGVFDLPPEHWIVQELFEFDTKRKNDTVRPPGLRQKTHPVFARKHWRNISDERYRALHQSMVLATNLINLSGPALACFFPNFRQNTKRGVRSSVVPDDEWESPRPGQEEQWSAALDIFTQKTLRSVSWWEDSTMWRREGWLGINMPRTAVPPFSPKTHWDWEEADELAGYPETRDIRIGLSSEFADTILANPPGSAKHLLATFYAGVTMMHELGHWCVSHVVYPGAPLHGEPYFGDNIEMEMGNSWISWLFGCHMHPEPITLKGLDDESRSANLFDHGLHWYPTYKCGDTEPIYVTQYSIPLSYVEHLMSAQPWEGQDLVSFTAPMRRSLIGPKREMFREGGVARVATGFKPKPWMDLQAFARPDQPRHINWDHAPLRYADFILSEKKRLGSNRKKSSDSPAEFSKLVYKLQALRNGTIPDSRRIVRRETDQVDMGECDSEELETLDPVVSPPLSSRARPVTSQAAVKVAHLHGRRNRPRSITISKPRRRSTRKGALDDSLAPYTSERSNADSEKALVHNVHPLSPVLIQTTADMDVNRPQVGKAKLIRKRKSVVPSNSSTKTRRTSVNRSSANTRRRSCDYIPPVPSVPDIIETTSSKFYTRLPRLRKKTSSAPTSTPTKPSGSVPRKTSSEVSTDLVIGQGTAQSPRRLGNRVQLPDVLYKPSLWPPRHAKVDSAKAETAKRRQSESAEANIKTPEWHEFDMQRVRMFYPRTRSQSRSIAWDAVRRKSSVAVPSPRTLVAPDGKRRRESSVIWETKYGKGQKGWYKRPYDAGNRRKSSDGPGRVNGSAGG